MPADWLQSTRISSSALEDMTLDFLSGEENRYDDEYKGKRLKIISTIICKVWAIIQSLDVWGQGSVVTL